MCEKKSRVDEKDNIIQFIGNSVARKNIYTKGGQIMANVGATVKKIELEEELKVTGYVTLEELLHRESTQTRHNAEDKLLFNSDLSDVFKVIREQHKKDIESRK